VFLFNKPATAAKPAATEVTAPAATKATDPVAVTNQPTAQAPKLLGVHTVIPRDTLWWISDKWYKDPVLWPAIYEINKGLINDPDLIFAGQKFDIPFLNTPANKLSAQDNTLLAQGYLEAYRVYKAKGKVGAEGYKTVGDKFATKK
jgi:LysM repeat protein